MDHSIVFSGEILEGFALEQVKANFARLFKVQDPSKVEQFFSGQSVVIKSGLSAEQAVQYQAALTRAGIKCSTEIKPISLPESEAEPQTAVWWIVRDAEKSGPFTRETLTAMAAGGQLRPDDLLWKAGLAQAISAKTLDGLEFSEAPAAAMPVAAPAGNYPHVCKTSGQLEAFNIGVGLLSLVLAIALTAFIQANTPVDWSATELYLMVAVMVLWGLAGLWMMVSGLRHRIVLHADAIDMHEGWGVNRIPRAAVRGRRYHKAHAEYVRLYSHKGDKTLTLVALEHINGDSLLAAWIYSLPDLDAQDRDAAHQKILEDPAFSLSPEVRAKKLAAAETTVKVCQGLAIALLGWGAFCPSPYGALINVAILMPWAGLWFARRSRGRYRFDIYKPNDPWPNLIALLDAPAFLLAGRAYIDCNTSGEWRTLLPSLLGAALVLGLARRADPTLRTRRKAMAWILAMGLLYTYGTLNLGNMLLDRSPGQNRTAQVRGGSSYKYGPLQLHKLELSLAGSTDTTTVTVPGMVFDLVAVGDTLCTQQHPGALGLSWLRVSPCDAEHVPGNFWDPTLDMNPVQPSSLREPDYSRHYDPTRKPENDLTAAEAKALSEHKRILMIAGGEWCTWCRSLHRFIDHNDDLKAYINSHFVVLNVYVGDEADNSTFFAQFPAFRGVPYFYILDNSGKLITDSETGDFEEGKSYSHDRLLGFLRAQAQ